MVLLITRDQTTWNHAHTNHVGIPTFRSNLSTYMNNPSGKSKAAQSTTVSPPNGPATNQRSQWLAQAF